MGAVVAGIIGLVVLVMNLQPASKVVLLPDADGRVGAVIVKTASEQRMLSTAYAGASVGTQGAIALQQEDPGEVNQRYAAALAARPASPVSFVLYFEFG